MSHLLASLVQKEKWDEDQMWNNNSHQLWPESPLCSPNPENTVPLKPAMMMMKNEAQGCAKLRPEQLSAELFNHLYSKP